MLLHREQAASAHTTHKHTMPPPPLLPPSLPSPHSHSHPPSPLGLRLFGCVWVGWSALEERDRDVELGAETRLSGLVAGFSGVEEASGASLSARSFELMLSV